MDKKKRDYWGRNPFIGQRMTKLLLICDFCQDVNAALFEYAMGHVVVYSGKGEAGKRPLLPIIIYTGCQTMQKSKLSSGLNDQNQIVSQQICGIKRFPSLYNANLRHKTHIQHISRLGRSNC